VFAVMCIIEMPPNRKVRMLEIMHQNNAFAMFLNPSREFQLPFSLARA
jgi:hypothetical protein